MRKPGPSMLSQPKTPKGRAAMARIVGAAIIGGRTVARRHRAAWALGKRQENHLHLRAMVHKRNVLATCQREAQAALRAHFAAVESARAEGLTVVEIHDEALIISGERP